MARRSTVERTTSGFWPVMTGGSLSPETRTRKLPSTDKPPSDTVRTGKNGEARESASVAVPPNWPVAGSMDRPEPSGRPLIE